MEELTSGCIVVDNNLPGQGMESLINAHGSLQANTNLTDEDGNILNPLSEEDKAAAALRLAEGDLPAQQPATALLAQRGNMLSGVVTMVPDAAVGASAVVTGGVIGVWPKEVCGWRPKVISRSAIPMR